MHNPKKAGLVDDLIKWEFGSYFELIKKLSLGIFDYQKYSEIFQFNEDDLADINSGFDDIKFLDL